MHEISTHRQDIAIAETDTPIGVTVVTVRGARPGPTLALLSGIHGDEWEGVVAVGRIHADQEDD